MPAIQFLQVNNPRQTILAGRRVNVQILWQHSDINLTILLQNISQPLNVLGMCVVHVRPDVSASSVVSSPHETAYAIQTRVHVITLHRCTCAVLHCTFQWPLSQTSHKTQYSMARLPLARLDCQQKHLTQSLQRVAVQIWICRNLCGCRWITLLIPTETELAGYSWFVCSTFSLGTFRT